MGVVSDCICLPLVCLTMPFSTEVDSQIAHKILDVEYLHSQYGKWDDITLGETPTDYEVFQTFLRCISQMGGASDSINLPLVGFTMPFSFTVDCQIPHKMWDFGDLVSTEIVMMYFEERQQLLMECFKASPRCI